MRYDGKDLEGQLPQNVHCYSWLPQNDLIHHKKARALISHGGYNSLQEAINAGIPIIAIPLFGDQPTNAKLAEKRHLGIVLQKNQISESVLTAAIKSILEDDSYSRKARHIRDLIRKKPFKPEELLVRWTEYIATFKKLPNLTPFAVNLSFITYYSIDVVMFLTISFAIIMVTFYAVVSSIL
ncbi:unnamed protein product [Enterobius vermicularis]|uniref:UDP-glucuronosyltransferase n=1 Tax=Enterobius vermicularis TaxID=51028 RepID=A0A0N4VAZ7_ENTVE|nr:unnamed protein product [Enterobius vermicularis]